MYTHTTYIYIYIYKTDNNFKYILTNIKCRKQLGLYDNNVEVTSSGVKGKSINMVEYQQIMVKTYIYMFDFRPQDSRVCATEATSSRASWTRKRTVSTNLSMCVCMYTCTCICMNLAKNTSNKQNIWIYVRMYICM